MLEACSMLSTEQILADGLVVEKRAPGSRHQRWLWQSARAMTLMVATQTLPHIHTAVCHA